MSESTEVTPLSPKMLAQFADMIRLVPGGSGGIESMLAQIFAANDLQGLDAPWQGDGLPELPVGPLLVFNAIEPRESDYKGGLGAYLVIDCISPSTGEVKKYSNGAVMVVGQLVKAFVAGEFPFAGFVEEVETRAGFKSQHIKVSHEDTARVRDQIIDLDPAGD